MKIVFFGTSVFAAEVLKHLQQQKDIEILAVVTRPDRPKGRSLSLSPPPVKEVSKAPVYQPKKASTDEFANILKKLHADLFVVVAYGEIIKANILQIPKLGCVNIHASLLPKYRGAAPIHRALMNGEKETGITIIEMVLQMDAGDMLEVVKTPVPDDMTFGELEKKLCELACIAIMNTIHHFQKGTVIKTPQDPNLVTFAAKLTPEDEIIDWNKPAKTIHNLIRAFSPRPGAWCKIKIGDEEKRLKIKRSLVIQEKSGPPKTFLSYGKEGWIVACGEQALQLLEVQLEGKNTLSTQDFLKGIHQKISLI